MSADPVAIARDLVRCPSVTPSEGGALTFLESILKKNGFTVHRMTFREPGTDDVENLYARIGTAAPNLVIAGHTDVVPTGDEKAWKHPPFSGEVANGELYGRGAVDMKGGIACAVAAVLDHLGQRGGKPKGSISFLITGDEEGIAVNGTPKLLKWAAERGEKFDHCILAEPSNQDELGDTIKIGRRGSLNGHLIVSGTQGHVAYPQRANNPIRGLVTLVSALQAEPLDQGSAQFAPSHLEFTSVDVGNKTVNLIPGEARARFNIRFNDNHTLEFAEKADQPARGESRRRKNQIHIPMGTVERRRVRNQAGAVHRSGRCRRRRGHRPQACTFDNRRHVGCAIHHAPLSRGRVRPGRPDDASDQRARAGCGPARADDDLSQDHRPVFRLIACRPREGGDPYAVPSRLAAEYGSRVSPPLARDDNY